MSTSYELKRAGTADRVREMASGKHARASAAVDEEKLRHAPERKWQRHLWTEDAAWFARLESEAVTEEQKAFAREWRELFEARLREAT